MNPELSAAASAGCIGIFDSGVGGLSVLKALRAALPSARLLYYADSGHAPYGERDDAYVLARCRHVAKWLSDRGATALVVACNTATAVALEALRDAHSMPVIGVEPGVKPAAALSTTRRIAVLATEGTLRSERFRRLVALHAPDCEVIAQACPGLAAAIESGERDGPGIERLVERHCAPLRARGIDVAVLGCTHYPFVRPAIERALGAGIAIVDTAEAIARQTAARCGGFVVGGEPATVLTGSGDLALLDRLARRWLDFEVEVKVEVKAA